MTGLAELSPVAIIGATRGTGERLLRRLMSSPGVDVVGIGRDRQRMEEIDRYCAERFGHRAHWRRLDVEKEEPALRSALSPARAAVHCGLPRSSLTVLKCLAPETKKFVCMGSARKFTRFIDESARDVIEAEHRVLSGPIPSVVLHPTMIYGGRGERNVSRIMQIVRRLPVIPLPRGGSSLVQPIACENVVDCIIEALCRDAVKGIAVTVAGLEPMTYADFVRACARATGHRVAVVSVPAWLAMAGARMSAFLPFLPTIEKAEMQRLLEDKDADISEMKSQLGVTPLSFEEGLKRVANQ